MRPPSCTSLGKEWIDGRWLASACSATSFRCEKSSIFCYRRAPQHGNALRARNGIREQFEPLSAERGITVGYSSEVGAGVDQSLDDTKADRVGYEAEYDGRRHTSPFEREDRGRSERDDHVGRLLGEVGDKGVEPISVPFPAEKLNGRGAAILVAQLAKRREQILDRRAVREAAVQDVDPPPLLCQRRYCERRGEWPSKEVTPSH